MNSITGTQTVTTTLQVSDENLAKAVYAGSVSSDTLIRKLRANLREEFKVPSDAYLDGWNWMHDVEYHTSHSFEVTNRIRAATKLEVSKINSLNDLQTLLSTKEQINVDVV